MNAIIGVCHFCEAHGPRPVFCTFTTDDESHTTESSKPTAQCDGCRSLGPETVYVTKDDDGIIYCSRESVPNADVTAFLRQAAIRSITCEVSWNKEGGIVYFSDARGHVLSLTFQLKDTRARGLKRWFSIVVLMKDKMLLLSVTPLLTQHMQEIAKELQQLAAKVYDEEQKVCSQRALRLNSGCYYFGQSQSLLQLTGEEQVFKKLHVYFTQMLKAGALNFTETLYTSKDMLQRMNPQESKGISVFTPNICEVENCMSLRALEGMLSKPVFRTLMYCMLVGINIIIKSTKPETQDIVRGLLRLVPEPNPNTNKHILVDDEASPRPSAAHPPTACVLEGSEEYCCRWPGVLPAKCPTLMTRIEKAMSNAKFNDDVVHQHVKYLQLEWLGIARTVKSAIDSSGPKSEPVKKLKQVLGVSPHDDLIVNYWISAYCT